MVNDRRQSGAGGVGGGVVGVGVGVGVGGAFDVLRTMVSGPTAGGPWARARALRTMHSERERKDASIRGRA